MEYHKGEIDVSIYAFKWGWNLYGWGEKERKKENQLHILFIPSKSASIGVQNTIK
jgi:hypothetical protein